ncbi:MAG: hypothetical protein ACHQXA_04605 [Gemmatimonadales bacterium]
MKPLILVALVLAVPVQAQMPQLRLSGGYALGGYREQGPTLDFKGSGPSARFDATWRRFGLTAAVTKLSLTPTDTAAGAVAFTSTETELALRYRPLDALPVETEVGVVRRTVSPGDAAQAMQAWCIGLSARFALAEGAALETRAAWLAGAKFSGGGTAGTALTLGLQVSYRPVPRLAWAWLVADYDFQRIDRETDSPVPIEASTVRLGLEARFLP